MKLIRMTIKRMKIRMTFRKYFMILRSHREFSNSEEIVNQKIFVDVMNYEIMFLEDGNMTFLIHVTHKKTHIKYRMPFNT